MFRIAWVPLFCLLFIPIVHGQGTITTVAGGVTYVAPAGPIAATAASLGSITQVATDAAGNIYALDVSNNDVIKITPNGTMTAVWYRANYGPPSSTSVITVFGGATATSIAVDPAGTVYVFYFINTGLIGVFNYLDRITPAGVEGLTSIGISCCANPTGFTTDAVNNFYYLNNSQQVVQVTPSGTQTVLPVTLIAPYPNSYVNGMTRDSQGNFYFSQGGSNGITGVGTGRILKATPAGVFSVIAGNGTSGYSGDGGPATLAALSAPTQMTVDAGGNLYFADAGNNVIRKINAAGTITTVAGTSTVGFAGDGGPATAAQFSLPQGVALDAAGNLYVGDTNNWRIRKIDTTGVITEFAGNGLFGVTANGGPATQESLWSPSAVVEDSNGNMYVTESLGRIRKISPAGVITIYAGRGIGFSGDGGPATQATFNFPQGMAVDAFNNLYVADWGNNRIRRITPQGIISTVAGGGTGSGCDNCPATSAVIRAPSGVAVDSAGNLYITDPYNLSVRKVDSSGTITTFATFGGSQQLPGPRAPIGVTLDGAGNLYVAWQNAAIAPQPGQGGVLQVTLGGIVTNVVGGIGRPAVALDSNGTLYVTDAYSTQVYRVTPTGATVTVTGTTYGYGGDGGPATAAQLASPEGIFIDSNGFLLIADLGNNRIRRVTGPGCTGAAEPVVTVPLQAGFYIAEVTNAPGSRNGYWGMVASVPQGSIPGGINLGGAILGNDNFPGYAAFTLPQSQTVTINVAAQALAGGNPFFSPAIYARLLDSNWQLVGSEVSGTNPLQFTNTLGPGFYILEVHTEANAPAVAFQASALTPSVTGGVIAGGYVSQGTLGYEAFSITQAQNVTLQLTGPSNGQFGAGCLQLTLLDINRNVVKMAP